MEAAELVAESVLGEFVTVSIGKKVFSIYPPTIKIICQACKHFSKIKLEKEYNNVNIIGEIPNNINHVINGISCFITEKKLERWKLRRQMHNMTNKEVKKLWDEVIPLIDGRDFFDYAFSMKSATEMIAKQK